MADQDLAALVAKLRHADEYEPLGHDGWEAADAIEAQAAEIARLQEAVNAEEMRANENKAHAEKAEAERQMLSEAICGGEDFPGLLASTPVEALVDMARKQHRDHSEMIDARMEAERERDEARGSLAAQSGAWRVFESVFRGHWGIEIEGDNDADPVLSPLKMDRKSLDIVVQAHNAALSESQARIVEQDLTIARLRDDLEQWRDAFQRDSRDTRYFSKMLTAQKRASECQAALDARINAAREEGYLIAMAEAKKLGAYIVAPEHCPAILAKIKEANHE